MSVGTFPIEFCLKCVTKPHFFLNRFEHFGHSKIFLSMVLMGVARSLAFGLFVAKEKRLRIKYEKMRKSQSAKIVKTEL